MNRVFSDEPSTPEAVTLPPFRSAPAPATTTGGFVNALPVHSPGLNLGDIYYVLFRHKWKILLCTAAAAAAAAAVHIFKAPPYQSEAKLFVRYIISENKALRPATQDAQAKSPDQRGETIMKSEAEILGSADLAKQVVDAIGAEKILARYGGGKDANTALAIVKGNLVVNVTPSSSVIHVLYRHPDPEIVQPVLREVIDRYFKLHVETHTANGMLGDFLTQETDQLRSRLSQTEEELRKATLKAGIVSLEDARKAYSDQLTGLRRELLQAQADLAQRSAVLEELNRRFPNGTANAASGASSSTDERAPALSHDILTKYQNTSQQILLLQQTERELLTQFTPENARVKEIRTLLADALQTRHQLQTEHPKLAELALASQRGPEASAIDSVVIATQVTALQAKIKILTKQLEEVRNDAARVDQMEGLIVELRRKKELEETTYRYYSASLEQSRINETLGNGRVSNISQIQAPTPPSTDRSKTDRLVGLIFCGGLFVGVAWAFLIELYLDRSLKRPVDVERSLNVPLFLSIPAIKRRQLKAAPLLLSTPAFANGAHANGSSGTNGSGSDHGANGHNGHAPDVATAISPLQIFHETLRDRLIGYFESINLTHKPKLVAVTGLAQNAGVTTTAAGLARSLSETGEGNVLLVDMNVGHGVAQQFMKGKAACGIDELLEARGNAHVDDKLYVVAETSSDRLTRNMPQRFTKLVPKLKASDFDYIIFDMPPISQISITPRLAGFMDMVLMVVESEKTDRDLVQRATALLAESRAHVGIVLNKTKRYVPQRLHQDNLSNG